MKKNCLSLMIFHLLTYGLFSLTTKAQSYDSIPPAEAVFTFVEQMPEFPGGEKEMVKFINENKVYPQQEGNAKISGKVYLTFVIDKEGNINDIRVMKGIPNGQGLEKEAIRLVKMMPKWKPGRQNGRPVKVQYNLPVRFNLN